MCKRGDIVVISDFMDGGKRLPRHSFVVIDDDGGKIRGLDFDFVALMMSSFKDEAQKRKKLAYGTNFAIRAADEEGMPEWAHGKEGYIKAEQFYYFNKSKTKIAEIGALNEDVLNELMDFIESLAAQGITFREITENL